MEQGTAGTDLMRMSATSLRLEKSALIRNIVASKNFILIKKMTKYLFFATIVRIKNVWKGNKAVYTTVDLQEANCGVFFIFHYLLPEVYVFRTGECIPLSQACDGFADCEDGSDENRQKCKVSELIPYFG